MKKNRTILIVVIILIVIAIVVIVSKSGKSTFSKKDVDFAVADTASVTKIFMADKKNRSVLLERMPGGSWRLNEKYKVRPSGVKMILGTLKKLTPKMPVPISAHNNIIAQLAAASVKVEVYQRVYRINLFDKLKLFPHEKLTKTFYVGSATADNMGTFMLLEGSDYPFVVHIPGLRGFVGPRFSVFEKDWRDHTVFHTKLADIKSVIMEIPREPENSFRVDVEGDNFKLTKLIDNSVVNGYDTLKLLNFMTAFADLRFESLMDEYVEPEKKDSIIHSVPQNILTVIDKNNDTTRAITFARPNENMAMDFEGNMYINDVDRLYALVNDNRDFVMLQYFVFDRVIRPLSYFEINKD
jgi:hypothetical protein